MHPQVYGNFHIIGNFQRLGMILKLYTNAGKEEAALISYEPLFETLKKRNISIYRLINFYHISRGTIDNLKHNRSITMASLNQLMETLGITDITEVIRYTPDSQVTPDEPDKK